MPNLDGRVNHLSQPTVNTLRNIAQQQQAVMGPTIINETQAQEIVDGIMADGSVSAAEGDLLDEILTRQSATFDPASPSVNFGGLTQGAKAIFEGVNQTARIAPGLGRKPYPTSGGIATPSYVTSSRGWTAGADVTRTPSGVMTNRAINETYNSLDQRMRAYTHDTSNWMSYGKYASREAGSQISNLEAAYEMLISLKNGNLSSATEMVAGMQKMFSPNGDGASFDPALAKQGLLMMTEVVGMADPSLRADMTAIASTLNKTPFTATDAAYTAGLLAKDLVALGVSAQTSQTAMKSLLLVISGVQQLHSGLVEGNTLIYENIAPAFDTFLDAEARGQDGIAALQAAGYGKPPGSTDTFASASNKDPQGFVLEAFKLYKEAHADLESGDPARVAAAEDKMHRANLMIGAQEQMAILQRPSIFGNPMMANFLHAMNGTMTLTDANGTHALLPNHNASNPLGWADFETRMGIRQVPAGTAGALEIRGADGQVRHYVQRAASDPAATGTIARYFSDGLGGTASQRLIESPPRPIYTMYSAVDIQYGSSSAQIGSRSVDGCTYTSANAAIAAAQALQGGSMVDASDYAVVKTGNTYTIHDIGTFAYVPDDITSGTELSGARVVSDRGIVAIVSEDSAVKRF